MEEINDQEAKEVEEEEEVKDEKVNVKTLQVFYVAGVQHHQMRTVIDEFELGMELDLEREPENPYDPNAIRITYNNVMCGYVPKKFSASLSAAIETEANIECVITKLNKSSKPWEWCQVEVREISD